MIEGVSEGGRVDLSLYDRRRGPENSDKRGKGQRLEEEWMSLFKRKERIRDSWKQGVSEGRWIRLFRVEGKDLGNVAS